MRSGRWKGVHIILNNGRPEIRKCVSNAEGSSIYSPTKLHCLYRRDLSEILKASTIIRYKYNGVIKTCQSDLPHPTEFLFEYCLEIQILLPKPVKIHSYEIFLQYAYSIYLLHLIIPLCVFLRLVETYAKLTMKKSCTKISLNIESSQLIIVEALI